MSKFYVTTPIYYVNDAPHIGHVYTTVVADVLARFHRMLGDEVYFLTGTDEHGQKIEDSASAKGLAPLALADRVVQRYHALWKRFGMTHNDFIRTTEERHKRGVYKIYGKIAAAGDDIYKGRYEGWYCKGCEAFYPDSQIAGGRCPDQGHPVERLTEESYFFRLSRYQKPLLEHYEKHPGFIVPETRRNEIISFVSAGLRDLSISRTSFRWGIPFPSDPKHILYVWFDALSNYVTAAGANGDPVVLATLDPHSALRTPHSALSLWPADAHVIGKDIIKFHAVYWPIMLKAAALPLPKQVIVHGWWQKDGEKMSKSTGNVVDPLAVINEWGVDAFRYYVVRELDIGPDGNWTDAGFAARYHAELANGLGNLVNRSLSMLKRYRNGVVPKRSDELAAEVDKAVSVTAQQLREYQLQSALETIWSIVSRANQYVDQTAPFKLAKDPSQAARLDAALYTLAETCRVLAVLLWPFLPFTAGKMYAQLGLGETPDKFPSAQWGGLPSGHTIGEIAPLFPRKDQPAK